jgi:hypothetical protein
VDLIRGDHQLTFSVGPAQSTCPPQLEDRRAKILARLEPLATERVAG